MQIYLWRLFWGGEQNAVAKHLESAALDRAGTRARGAAPPAGHGPIRAPELGAGVLDAVLHAARRARPPGRGAPAAPRRPYQTRSSFGCLPVRPPAGCAWAAGGRFSCAAGHWGR